MAQGLDELTTWLGNENTVGAQWPTHAERLARDWLSADVRGGSDWPTELLVDCLGRLPGLAPVVCQAYDGPVDAERLVRHLGALIASAGVAVYAKQVLGGNPDRREALVQAACGCARLLGRAEGALPGGLDETGWQDERGLVNAVYDQLAAAGWWIAGARDWSLSWLGYSCRVVAQRRVRLPVACVDSTGGYLATLTFEAVAGQAGEVYEANDGLYPLGGDLVHTVASAAKGAGCAVRWHLDPPPELAGQVLHGPSLGGAAYVLAASLRDNLPVDEATLIVAQVPDSHLLEPVGGEPAKLDAALADGQRRIRVMVLAAGASSTTSAQEVAATDAGIRVVRCANVDGARAEACRLADHLKDYLSRVIAEPAECRLPGGGERTVAAMYVEPDVLKQKPPSEAGGGGRPRQEEKERVPWKRERRLLPHRCIIIGPPGQGKTTLARMTVQQMAETARAELGQWPFEEVQIPLRVPLADVFGRVGQVNDSAFDAWLQNKVSAGGAALPEELAAELRERMARRRGLVLFLDGLDELDSALAEQVWTWAGEQQCPMVVTSRPYGYLRERSGVVKYELADLRPRQSRALIGAWFAGAPEQIELVQQALAESALREVGTNPYLLSLVCAVSQAGELRSSMSRVDLYEAFVRLLLRGEPPDQRAVMRWRSPLGELAFKMVEGSPARPDVEDVQLSDWVDSKDLPGGVEWLERHRVLFPGGGDQWVFAHRSIAGYLAAKHMVGREDGVEQALGHIYEPEWQEALLFFEELVTAEQLRDYVRRLMQRTAAGEDALLRPFLTASRAIGCRLPDLRPNERRWWQGFLDTWSQAQIDPFLAYYREVGGPTILMREALQSGGLRLNGGQIALGPWAGPAGEAALHLLECLDVPGCEGAALSALTRLSQPGAAAVSASELALDLLRGSSDCPMYPSGFGQLLVELGDPRSVAPLQELLRHPEHSVSSEAAETLNGLAGVCAEHPLAACLRDDDAWVREHAAQALASWGDDPSLVPALMTCLGDPEADVRRRAASALGRVGDREALHPLLKSLEADPDQEVRSAAAHALQDLRHRSAAACMVALLPKEHGLDVRWDIVQALGFLGDADARPVLRECLDDSQLRFDAACSLARLGDSSGVAALLEGLFWNPVTRASAMVHLPLLCHESPTDSLVAELSAYLAGVLVNGEREVRETAFGDVDVHQTALELLKELADLPVSAEAAGVPLAEAVLARDDAEDRARTAIWALSALGYTQTVPILIHRLQDDHLDWSTGIDVVQALGRLGDRGAVRPLWECLEGRSRGWAADLARSDVEGWSALAGAEASDEDAQQEPSGADEVVQALLTEFREFDAQYFEPMPELDKPNLDKRIAELMEHSTWAIAVALAELGDGHAAPLLHDFIAHENALYRRTAAEALLKLGDVRGVQVLLDCLGTIDFDCIAAFCELERFADEAAVPALIEGLRDASEYMAAHRTVLILRGLVARGVGPVACALADLWPCLEAARAYPVA